MPKTLKVSEEIYDLVEELAETCDMTIKATTDEIIDYFFRGQFEEDKEEDEWLGPDEVDLLEEEEDEEED